MHMDFEVLFNSFASTDFFWMLKLSFTYKNICFHGEFCIKMVFYMFK